MPNAIFQILWFLLFSLSAMAGKVNLDARTDFESYSASDSVGRPAYSVFRINRLKIDFQNVLGDANSFRARLDPLKIGDSTVLKNKRDGVSSFVDFGFISHKLSDEWAFSMGKIITGMGGTEGANNPGDVYLRSVAGEEIAAVYWPVGAQLQGTCGDQKININVANITEDVTDGSVAKNLSSTSQLMGFTYTGKLSNAQIIPTVSYHTETFNDTGLTKTTKSYLAIGAKFLISDFEIETDYLDNSRKFDPQSTQLIETVSGVGLVRYKLETGSVHFKYESSNLRSATSANTDSLSTLNSVTAAYEFKPSKDDNWRAHLAAIQRDTKADGVDPKSEKKVYFGVRILADFLK